MTEINRSLNRIMKESITEFAKQECSGEAWGYEEGWKAAISAIGTAQVQSDTKLNLSSEISVIRDEVYGAIHRTHNGDLRNIDEVTDSVMDYVRPYLATHKSVSSEIPLLTDEEQLGFLAENLLKMLADHVYNCATPLRTKLCLLIRPYLATRGPVSVSLEKCVKSLIPFVKVIQPQGIVGGGENGILTRSNARDLAKAVLDAAGVKYVE